MIRDKDSWPSGFLRVVNFEVVLRGVLVAFLAVAGVQSLFDLRTGTSFPVELALDIWIVVLFVRLVIENGLSVSMRTNWLFFLISSYGFIVIVIAQFNQAPWLELGQSYRWAFYALVFSAITGRKWGFAEQLAPITWTLWLLAAVKVILSTIFFSELGRPILLVESNFELALFTGLTVIVYPQLSRHRWALICLAGFVVLMENSRSGAVAFFCLGVYALFIERNNWLRGKELISNGLTFFFTVTAPFLVFQARFAHQPAWKAVYKLLAGQGPQVDAQTPQVDAQTSLELNPLRIVEESDRGRFLNVFFRETGDWSLWNWVFGTAPVTPLSEEACDFFSWSSLVSSQGDGSCYSVVFHVFLARVIFDAGLFGLFLAFFTTVFILRRAGVSWALSAALLGIAVSNSLSVSGLNNPYVAVVIVIAALYRQGPKDGKLLHGTTRDPRGLPAL